MRYLGVDLGDARTGLAVSDPHGIICSPVEVVEERDRDRLLIHIVQVAGEQEVDTIVVGLPRSLRGGTNPQAEKILLFVTELTERTGLRVETWDERFTSRMAEAHGKKDRPRDAVAACYMLQNYLDARAGTRGGE